MACMCILSEVVHNVDRRAYAVYIAQSLNNECQGFLVVAHATQQKHHLWHEVSLGTDIIGLLYQSVHRKSRTETTDRFQIIVCAGP
jgi:hypothetical protein